MTLKRMNVPGWDETFMNIALIAKNRSKDPSTQVGACIVSEDHRILSLGYNGAPNGFDDDIFPWGKEGDPLDTKYPYVVHAERNAILNFRGSLKEFNDSIVYVTHFPCNECAKELIQVGISKVFYLTDHNLDEWSTKATIKMFDIVGIEYKKINIH